MSVLYIGGIKTISSAYEQGMKSPYLRSHKLWKMFYFFNLVFI